MLMYEETWVKRTYFASADLSAKLYHFVKRDGTTGKIGAITADTDVPYGVLVNKPTGDGVEAEVVRSGLIAVWADAAIAVAAVIGVSADGQATTRVIGTDTTKYVVGTSEQAATGAGSLVLCFINCADPHRAA